MRPPVPCTTATASFSGTPSDRGTTFDETYHSAVCCYLFIASRECKLLIRLGVRGMPKHEEGPVEHEKSTPEQTPSKDITDRRDFLKKCGKFAAVTPPAITMLL